ncbi:DNRLRE domain-containing protein [Labilibacter sediminis]|nr:DNRLRE domain-containing protein [Labilibacter sediminis]
MNLIYGKRFLKKSNVYLTLCLVLLTSLSNSFAQGVFTSGRYIYDETERYIIRGICYSPVPIGSSSVVWDLAILQGDIALMKEAGINTVRIYRPVWETWVLDEFAANDIKIIMGFAASADLKSGDYITYINTYKNHDAILLWDLGNEYNYHPEWFENNIDNWYTLLNDCAATIHSIDPNHPVSTSHGEVPTVEVLNKAPNVDVWGMNVYRWDNSNDAISDFAAISDLPCYLSETGGDSYNSDSSDPVYAYGENQQMQADANEVILTNVFTDLTIGSGCALYAFTDGWYKAGNPDQQDTGGSAPNSSGVPYDGAPNEEYWGITDIYRNKKLTFDVVKNVYLANASDVALNPTHDAYVRGGSSADINYGTNTDLLVKMTAIEDYNRKIYLQFDLSEYNNIESATLRLYANQVSPFTVTAYEASNNSWDESSITWNNAPAQGAAIDAVAITTSGRYFEWDVTSYIAQAAGNNVVTIILSDASTTDASIFFNSKEVGTNSPKLFITPEYVDVPDTEAPTAPSNLSATPSITSVQLDWSASSDNIGVTGYNVYNGTSLITNVSSTSYNVTGLTESTAYTFNVSAVDAAGNESSQASVNTSTSSANHISSHVQSIETNIVDAGQGKKKASATVTIHDNLEVPVNDANVTVTFTGAVNETVSGITGSDGTVTLISTATGKGNFSFDVCVDNVTHNSLIYDAASNDISCNQLKTATLAEMEESVEIVTIYPNPVNDILYFKNADSIQSISIFNSQGKLVVSVLQNTEFIDLSSYPSGMYTILLSSENEHFIKKIIKK